MAEKPLRAKAYGSIPHLPGSRLGTGDHHCAPGQAEICTMKGRDRRDFVSVTEKADGTCVAAAKVEGVIVPLIRAGYPAVSSRFEQHHLFAQWVYRHYVRFDELLDEGERLVGEWLAQAHGTRYSLRHEPFIAFDLMRVEERGSVRTTDVRAPFAEFQDRVAPRFVVPHLLHQGGPFAIEDALRTLGEHGFHGALDQPEGAVWRVERDGKVDFLAKYVRPSKVDGRYLPEVSGQAPIWNWRPAPSVDELVGIAPDFTGDLSSDEFVRRQRA